MERKKVLGRLACIGALTFLGYSLSSCAPKETVNNLPANFPMDSGNAKQLSDDAIAAITRINPDIDSVKQASLNTIRISVSKDDYIVFPLTLYNDPPYSVFITRRNFDTFVTYDGDGSSKMKSLTLSGSLKYMRFRKCQISEVSQISDIYSSMKVTNPEVCLDELKELE